MIHTAFTVNMDWTVSPIFVFIPSSALLSVHTHTHTFVIKVYRGAWCDVKLGRRKRSSIAMETHLPQFLYDLWSIPDLSTWRLYYCTDVQPCTKEELFGKRDKRFRLLEDDCLGAILKCLWTLTSRLSFMANCINRFYCLFKVCQSHL